ncbi:MAG TPA: carbohydrate porin [Bacteroidales bacterium]|nr:carbohydrate porin [Bacteroidales bacterium]
MDFIGLHNHDRKNYGLLHGETDITAMLNTESLRLFRGGELSFQLRGIFVDKSSGDFVGYLQVFSNIENGFRIFLYQAYYKYTINKFIVKPGQLAYNADLLSHEPAIELTFRKYITTNIIFQPDFQYIINPGATSAAVNNSFIGLARLMLVYKTQLQFLTSKQSSHEKI